MTPKALQAQLVEIAENSRSVDIRASEGRPLCDLVDGLIPEVHRRLREGTDLLERVLEVCDHGNTEVDAPAPVDDSSECFYVTLDQLVRTCRDVSDIAYMGRFELVSCQRRLEELQAKWRRDAAEGGERAADDEVGELDLGPEIIASCGSSRRRIVKVVTAIERVLCDSTGLEPRLDYITELKAFLDLRYALTRLRRTVVTAGEPGHNEVGEVLRRAGTAIAQLMGRDAFWHMRYDERLQLRRLQDRILAWLRPDRAADPTEGCRLWQDVVGFVQLVDEISHREELRSHDCQLAEELHAELFAAGPPPSRVPKRVWDRLKSLYGCDEELEALTERLETLDPSELRGPLDRIRGSDRQGSPAPSSRASNVDRPAPSSLSW